MKGALYCLSQSPAVATRPTQQSFQRNALMIGSLSFSAFGTLGSPYLSKYLDQPRFSDIPIICVASVHLCILSKYYIVNEGASVVFNIDFLAVNFKLT